MFTTAFPHWGQTGMPTIEQVGSPEHQHYRDRPLTFDSQTGECCIVFNGRVREIPTWLDKTPIRLWSVGTETRELTAPAGKYMLGDSLGWHSVRFDPDLRVWLSSVTVQAGSLPAANKLFDAIMQNNITGYQVDRTNFAGIRSTASLRWTSRDGDGEPGAVEQP